MPIEAKTAVRLDDGTLAELRELAEREMRLVANIMAVLLREALDARKRQNTH